MILKAAVGREKAVQAIDVHRECNNCVVTFWVMSQFLHFLGASRGCADFRDPTAVFRFKTHQRFNGFTGPLNGNVEKSRQRRSCPLPPLLTPNFFLLTSNFSLFHRFGELRW